MNSQTTPQQVEPDRKRGAQAEQSKRDEDLQKPGADEMNTGEAHTDQLPPM
jgi:hypothetical protein